MKQGTETKLMGMTFITGISKKFDKDLYRVVEILSKEKLTAADRLELIRIYAPAYHDSGKIEGITSCDSSCRNCQFCQKMLAAAKADPTIICGLCYDEAQEKYKLNSVNRHSLNMLIMMTVEFTEKELKMIRLTTETRINSSGDTPNVIYAKNMLRMSKVHRDVRVGYWAKHTAPVIEACDELGKPKNVTLVQSSPRIGTPVKLAKYFDYTFTVYPDEKSVLRAIANGASPCNGMKCETCGKKCYYRKHKKGSDIAELLRGVSDAQRKILVDLTV